MLVDHWVIQYGIQTYLLTDNGLEFVSMFFIAVTARLIVEHLMTTAYHTQTTGQVESSTEHSLHSSNTTFQTPRPIGTNTCNP